MSRSPVPPADAARARRARAAALAEEAHDVPCVWTLGDDGPGLVVDWPATAEALYGVPARQALGRPRADVLASVPARGTWAEAVTAVRAHGRWEGEVLHTAPDGRSLLTDTRLVRAPDGPDAEGEGGAPLLVVEIARDVTARRVAEEALRASQNRLAAIVDSALDAIVTVDEAQHVVLFNGAAERLFGVRAADAIGEPLDRFIPPRYRAPHRAHIARFGATGVSGRGMSPVRTPAGGMPSVGSHPAHREGPNDPPHAPPNGSPNATDGAEGVEHPGTVVALRADGTEFPIEAAISQVETPDGRFYTVIVRDVTGRVQAEAERERLIEALENERAQLAEFAMHAEAARAEAVAARREAEAASHAKSAFLATMSHELRTPLNAVLGYAELLDLGLAGAVSDAQRQYLDRIAASGRHLLGLITDVLDLSKIEAGEMAVRARPHAAGPALRAAVALVRPQAAARGLTLGEAGCGDADDDGPAYLGDERRVQQILVNLLSNAVKFTEPGGRVVVECAATREPPPGHAAAGGAWVTLRVHDTGIGIPAEQLELVFNRFHQVEPADAGPYRRTQGGTGLGLAISRELARLMGGDLTAESAAGRGSTFTLWLPAAGADAPAGAAAVPPRAGAPVGVLLGEAVPAVVAAWTDRLRADPLVPHARELSPAELEDHVASYLADLAQQFVIFDDARAARERVALVRDGATLRALIARQHGRQRARLGWDAAALAREFAVLGEELERALAVRLADVPPGTVDDARELARAWLATGVRESTDALRAAYAEGAEGTAATDAPPSSSAPAAAAGSGRANR